MSDKRFLIEDIREAIAKQAFPTVTLWNRLEGRPRAPSFDRALRAEVRDALWFLTRQWQMGELTGDDAGTPVLAKLHVSTTRLTKYRAAGGAVEPFDDAVPLEAKVERRPVQLTQNGRPASLDLRLLMGRQWLKLVDTVGDYRAAYVARYPIARPDPSLKEDAPSAAHIEAHATFAAVAQRRMDGASLYLYLRGDPARRAVDGIAVAPQDEPKIDAIAARFLKWFEDLFLQPAEGQGDAWQPARLEYAFACSAPGDGVERVLTADEYFHGHLDWYSFDVDPGASSLGGLPEEAPDPRAPVTQTSIPVPIAFEGMPNPRWWAFEDGKTNFGDVKPDTTDLAKLLLIEFGLVYANDWCLIPLTLPAGSLARVEGLAVTNVFGERTWIEPAGAGGDDDWQAWRFLSLSAKGDMNEPADTSLLLVPAAAKVHEGKPLEEVALVRDEMANMVWGIEQRIPLATGEGKPGAEAAAETLSYHRRLLGELLAGSPPAPASVAPIRYELMNTVPEHWIPFVPVRVPGSSREVQLQRAAMPRVLEGDPERPVRVRPRTGLLREGLDASPPSPYFVHEEEVPRAGVRVSRSFQRTRWLGGKVLVWLGARKQTGRGESSSGLAFDRIVPRDSNG
ncbi:hypothetical protein [Sorangium sp. So ce406]|uniref:hypothetical protein n=1 Tax=Sorangium sp. So ce406 TaxID=3133311 RepID=UPI003F5B88CA